MREIKFRFLSSYDNKFFYIDILNRDDWREGWDEKTLKTAQQYTGLHDKNGVEIYEGDIVRGRWGEKIKVEIEPIFHSDYEDTFCGFGFGLQTHEPDDFRDTVEIIGNIYENPELLKETE